MRRIIQLTCMCGILLMSTQCVTQNQEPNPIPDPGPEPNPITVQETWKLIYDDYRGLKYGSHEWSSAIPIPEEYQNLSRDLSVLRSEREISIKGMFPEYPEASFKGIIEDDKVLFEPTQLLEGTGNEKLYFHCGLARQEFPGDKPSDKDYGKNIIIQISFNPVTGTEERPSFQILEDHKDRTLRSGHTAAYSFWLTKDKEGLARFYTQWKDGQIEGTGFPDAQNFMINMRFLKVSDGDENNADSAAN